MRVQIDATTKAYLVNRWLAYSVFTKYTMGKPTYSKSFYTIQWRNIKNDLRRLVNFASQEWAFRYAYGIFGLVVFLKTGNPIHLFLQGAVAFDVDGAAGSDTVGQTSLSTTHTATGSNRYASAGLSTRRQTLDIASPACTYDGTSMVVSGSIVGAGRITSATMFTLANPSTTVGASVTASWTNGQSWTELGVCSFTGATALGTASTTSGTGDQSITLTDGTANDMAVDCIANDGRSGGGQNLTGNQTVRYQRTSGADFDSAGQTAISSSSILMKYTVVTQASGSSFVAINILATAASTPSRLASMMVG